MLSLRIAALVAASGLAAPAFAVTTEWTGLGDGVNWSDPANWDNGVPVDATFDAIIPGGHVVTFDLGAATTINDLRLDAGSTLNFLATRSLAVQQDAQIGGRIEASNASFTATGAAAYTGNGAQFSAVGGSTVTFAGTTYDARGISSQTFLFAQGAGSLLDLSATQSLDASADFGGSPTRTISAVDGGVIDLSSLQSVKGGGANDLLRFDTANGGSIDLSSLTELTSGRVEFRFDTLSFTTLAGLQKANALSFDAPAGSTIQLTALQQLTNSILSAPDNGVVNAPALTIFDGSTLNLGGGGTVNVPAFDSITNSRFNLTGGASFGVAATEYDMRGIASGDVASASGASGAKAASSLDLSSVTEINGASDFGGSPTRTFHAFDGGLIDLSGTTTVRGGLANDTLEFRQGSGGSIDLSSLSSIIQGRVRFTLEDAAAYSLPALQNATFIDWNPTAGATIDAPMLVSQLGGEIDASGATTYNLGALTTLHNSTVRLGVDGVLNTPQLSSITNSRFVLTGGASLAIGASAYDVQGISSGDIASVSGAFDDGSKALVRSTLDLSTVGELDASTDFGGSPVRTVRAFDSGLIDLSGLTTVRGGSVNDILEFRAEAGGEIDLSSLSSIPEGRVRFSFDDPALLAVPELQTASWIDWNALAPAQVEAPKLVTQLGGEIAAGNGVDFSFPALTTLHNAAVSVAGDGVINAPELGSITNSRFTLTGGAQLSVGANGYDVQGISSGDIVSVSGFGGAAKGGGIASRLDLSAVTELDASTDFGGSPIRTIRAFDGGHVDLSGLTTLRGGLVNDRLDFVASSGGVIDLTSLQSVSEGNVRFDVQAEGTILVDALTATGNLDIFIQDPSSTFRVNSSLLLDPEGALSAASGSTIEIGGNFSHAVTDETQIQATSAILEFPSPAAAKAGSDSVRILEVAGLDEGAMDPGNSGNFGFGQLIVGSEAGPGIFVVLEDVVDNGNRNGTSGGPEALYLYSLGGPSGLVVNSGSTFVINNLNVYFQENGEWVHLNSLFPEGEVTIPFDNGFVTLPSPGAVATLGLAFGVALRRRRGER